VDGLLGVILGEAVEHSAYCLFFMVSILKIVAAKLTS
jgi:hypothetical protein